MLWSWIADLTHTFGWSFLMAVCYYHHVLKGFVLMYTFTSFDWVLASHHVRGPRLQALKTIALLPWVLKPVLGITSDMFPIFGRSKAPYVILVTLIGCPACAFIAFYHRFDVFGNFTMATVTAFFCIGLQICTCDLLLEAAVAERIRKSPKKGPSLMAFMTGGQTVGEALAIGTIGWVLEYLGPRGPCLLALPLTWLAFVPAVGNWLGESECPEQEASQRRKAFFTARNRRGGGEIPFLVAAVGVGSLVILQVASNTDSEAANPFTDPLSAASYQLKLIALLAILIIASFCLLLNPTIGLMNAFFFLQSTSTISVEGGAFYFFTDDSASYPMGPHFSVWFYTTGLGLVASAFGIMGLWIYNHFMAHWRYRNLLLTSNLLWILVSSVSVLVFTRRNIEWGIPDDLFVLGGTVLQNVFVRWAYVPGGLLLCQVCPEGLEATMFALLAGCQNLGRSVASIFGTYLLAYLGVEPDGTPQDSHCFDHLWIAAVLQSILPLLTLGLLPRMIPDASQTDHIRLTPDGPVGDTGGQLDSDPRSSVALATSGSLWGRLCLFLSTYWGPTTAISDAGTGVSYGTSAPKAGHSGWNCPRIFYVDSSWFFMIPYES